MTAPCWWTTAELRILRAHYPAHGPAGCAPLLPGRTAAAIARMANKIGLRKARSGAGVIRRPHAFTAAQRSGLAQLAGGPPPTRAEVIAAAQRLGLPFEVVRYHLDRAGNPIRRVLHRWTAQQDALLRRMLGATVPAICQALQAQHGVARTTEAVLMRMSILGLSVKRMDRGGLTVREICDGLGVKRNTIAAGWVKRLGLPTTRWHCPKRGQRPRSPRGTRLIISHRALGAFLRAHPRVLANVRRTANRLFLADLLGEIGRRQAPQQLPITLEARP